MFIALYSELRAETMWQYGGLQMLCTANCHTKITIVTSPIPLYSWVPILTCACICCVINEKSKFYTKNAIDWKKKKHLRLNIPFSGLSYGNSLYITFASRRTVTWFQLSIRCTTQWTYFDFIIYSCLYLYYVVKELYANL
jgi:hypothetical protein